jgi:hypothetical protein
MAIVALGGAPPLHAGSLFLLELEHNITFKKTNMKVKK